MRYLFLQHVAVGLVVGVPAAEDGVGGVEILAEVFGFEMAVGEGAVGAAMVDDEGGLVFRFGGLGRIGPKAAAVFNGGGDEAAPGSVTLLAVPTGVFGAKKDIAQREHFDGANDGGFASEPIRDCNCRRRTPTAAAQSQEMGFVASAP